MKIYTGFGDKGKTALFGGEKVGKDHLRVETYGALDELNSWLGLLIIEIARQKDRDKFLEIQHDLFAISSEIATSGKADREKLLAQVELPPFQKLEQWIDEWQKELPELKRFILPGGNPAAAYSHLARTVCRRAERTLVRLSHSDPVPEIILIYVNRLSDLLFVFARRCNNLAGQSDVEWNPSLGK